jgi:hypothetical protein
MNLLQKNWIAGFIDGDGSLALEREGNFYRPSLSISQNDYQLLLKIKEYFGCGTVTQKDSKSWHYRCRSAEQFQEFIIPRLGKAPFQTIKQFQYELICEKALPILINNSQKNRQDILDLDNIIKQIKESRNNSNYVNSNQPIDFMWFLGFFEAEGNFYLSIRNSYVSSDSNQMNIRIAFKVTQKNKLLLEKIKCFFNFGKVQSEGYVRNIWKYNVEGITNVTNHGFSIFRTNPLNGKKNLQRIKFLIAIRTISKGEHKTENGLLKLKKLETDMQKLRS